jgi:hypothetical protein
MAKSYTAFLLKEGKGGAMGFVHVLWNGMAVLCSLCHKQGGYGISRYRSFGSAPYSVEFTAEAAAKDFRKAMESALADIVKSEDLPAGKGKGPNGVEFWLSVETPKSDDSGSQDTGNGFVKF